MKHDYAKAIEEIFAPSEGFPRKSFYPAQVGKHIETVWFALKLAQKVTEPSELILWAGKYHLPHGTGNRQIELALESMIKQAITEVEK